MFGEEDHDFLDCRERYLNSSVVYRLRFFPEDRHYTGSTSCSIEERLAQHKNTLSDRLLYQFVDERDGWHGLTIIILKKSQGMNGPGHIMRVENLRQRLVEEDSCMTLNRDDPQSLNMIRASMPYRKSIAHGIEHAELIKALVIPRRSRSLPRNMTVQPTVIATTDSAVQPRILETRETSGIITWKITTDSGRVSEQAVNRRGYVVSLQGGICVPRNIPEEFHDVFNIIDVWGPVVQGYAQQIVAVTVPKKSFRLEQKQMEKAMIAYDPSFTKNGKFSEYLTKIFKPEAYTKVHGGARSTSYIIGLALKTGFNWAE